MRQVINKTLILRLSSIGDVVLATPFLRVFRAAYPDAEIDFVVKKEFADLLRHNPNITRLHELDASLGREELLRWKKFFSSQQYDAVFDLHNNFRTKILRGGIRAPRFVVNKRTLERWLLVQCKWNLFREIIPVAERYIETVATLHVKPDQRSCEIYTPPHTDESVRAKLTTYFQQNELKPMVALCPGAKHFTKRWSVEYYASLARRITEKLDYNIIVLGGPDEAAICETIASIDRSRIFNTCGAFSLLESVAAFDHCALAVTNDSGLMHIATARDCPVLAIFGSTVREFGFAPYNAKSIIMENSALTCRPCSHIGRSACPKEHFRCMKEITPDLVFEETMKYSSNNLNLSHPQQRVSTPRTDKNQHGFPPSRE